VPYLKKLARNAFLPVNVNIVKNLKLRYLRCVCNIKVQCKVVKNTTNLLSVIIVLIERHVSAYSEAIIRFNRC
jgi:hypothetical protein